MVVVQKISGDDTGGPPSRGVVILCLLLTLVSAWVTDFIGIDAIFGAFIAGIIVPREHRWEGECRGMSNPIGWFPLEWAAFLLFLLLFYVCTSLMAVPLLVCLFLPFVCSRRFLFSSLHVRIVELVQDVVSVLLLPLYFAVSGLKTDLTLLDNATSWGICVLTILAACLGAGQGA